MEAIGILLALLLLIGVPVCTFVALGLAIGARRRLEESNELWRKRARELNARIEGLEAKLDVARRGTPHPEAPPPAAAPALAPARPPEPPPIPAPVAPAPRPAPPAIARAPEPAREPVFAAVPESRARGPSLEERIGGSWFNWVGILAILFGVAYAMKYSFERGWVTPVMRFQGGLALGTLLLAAGSLSHRRAYAILARGFWGGGIGVLFVVFFAGFKLLLVDGAPILGRGTAFAGMAATVALGVLIAIRYDTRTTAVLAAVGGYLTPVLLRAGVPDQVFLFTYLAILTGGLLFLGYWKRWGFLRLLTFAVVVAYFAGWWSTEGTGAPWAMLLFPSLLFLFFATEILAWSVWRRVADASVSYVVLGLATTLHTLSALRVFEHDFEAFQGLFLLATSAYLLICARTVLRHHAEDRPLALCYGYAAGVLFLLMPAFETRLVGPWIACAWAIQGALLDAWGVRGHVRGFAYAGYALGALRLLAYDTPHALADVIPYAPFWNERALTYTVVFAALAFGCWRSLGRERKGDASEAEHTAATVLWVAALSLPAVLLSLELAQGLRVYAAPRYGGATAAYAHDTSHWMTLLWAAYATLVATVTGRRGRKVLRDVALLFGAFVVVHLVIRGLIDTYVTQGTPLLNSRFGVTVAVALCLGWSAREFRFVPALAAAHLFLLAGLSMEWVDLCGVRGIGDVPGLAGAPWYGLSILVAAYGATLLAWGREALRPVALVLVAGAAAKFLALDVAAAGQRGFLELRALAGAAAAAACFFAGARASSIYLRLMGHVTLLVALSADVLDFADAHAWTNGPCAMVGLWSAYGILALRIGCARARPHLRGLGLVLVWLAPMAGIVMLPAGDRAVGLFLHARFLGLGMCAAALLLAAEPYRHAAPGAPLLRWDEFEEGPAVAVPLSLGGHALVMLLLTLEAADHFHVAGGAEHLQQLSYSLIWATYAIGMVIGGFLRRYRPVRLMALAVLVGTIAKVFAFDLSFLEGPYRFLSFLGLGAVLVAVSFLYHKYRHLLA
ncbi:MAG TPA: DUF2339 domain-containing protein [Planctomycetota bacterium]|nr:DUF2339 domain-containing protein [Planctomycetota bacterium]